LAERRTIARKACCDVRSRLTKLSANAGNVAGIPPNTPALLRKWRRLDVRSLGEEMITISTSLSSTSDVSL
jgi:hypothetical protein